MIGPGVWTGLADSVFLAEVDGRDREPVRIGAMIAGGLAVGSAAALAGWILVVVLYTLLTGHGSEGLRGVNGVAATMADLRLGGLSVTLLRLLVTTATDGVFLLAFVALAAMLAHHRLKIYLTAARRIRWRLLAVGLALAAVAMSPLVVVDRMSSADHIGLPILDISHTLSGRLTYGVATLLLIPAAAAEEVFFRGWLLRQISAFSRRPVVLIGLSALIFSGLHFDFSPDGFLTRALMGAAFAYMTLRLGGLEFAAGVHAANNILIVLFLQPLNLSVETADGLSLAGLLEDSVLIGGYILMTEAVARLPALRRLAGLSATEISRSGAASPKFG